MEKVISIEVAEKEVNDWVGFKKISSSKVEENKDSLKSIATSISEGVLTLDADTYEFTHQLKFPVGEVKELKYKARISMKQIHTKTRNIKPGDTNGLISAYIAALTNQNTGLIEELDTEDNRIAQSIAVFFL